MFDIDEVLFFVGQIIPFAIAIIVHEVAHGYVAFFLGDKTAKQQGRLSLNPLHHIDPFGTIILPCLLYFTNLPIFGYAKPVPVDSSKFKHPRRDDLLVSLSGPFANFVLFLIGVGIAGLAAHFIPQIPELQNETTVSLLFMLYVFIQANIVLMAFNLLPIPPLDGSSIIMAVMPRKYMGYYYKYLKYSLPILFLILFIVPRVTPFDPINAYIQFMMQMFLSIPRFLGWL